MGQIALELFNLRGIFPPDLLYLYSCGFNTFFFFLIHVGIINYPILASIFLLANS